VVGFRFQRSAGRHPDRSSGKLRRALAVGAVASGVCLIATPAVAATAGGSVDVGAIAAKVDPAVVDITTTLANGAAAGTGMVLTSDGVVLTNNHVIDGATSINVQVAGTGPTYSAHVLGYDAADDVALLKVDGVSGLDTISTADSDQVQVGDPVVGLGNALGRGGTPATAQGSVTAVGQTITASDESGSDPETLNGAIQIDAPIQPGDSGGPLVNADGAVIGMDSAGSSSPAQARGAQGATEGFAIPIDHALDIANQIENGSTNADVHLGPRAILGVEIQPSGFEGMPAGEGDGVQIVGVQPGSPAESAGLTAGDTITALDGRAVGSPDDISAVTNAHRPNDQVDVQWVDASGQTHDASVTLVEGPPA
jgi:S1-C subfamily serine protease